MDSISDSGSERIILVDKKPKNKPRSGALDDAELVRLYDRATSKEHNIDSSPRVQQRSIRNWKVGDQCMAPYEEDGKWYPAKIEFISDNKRSCKIQYLGYEQMANVKMEDLMDESDVEEADVEDVHELREETINDVEDGNVRGVEEEALIVMEETNEEKNADNHLPSTVENGKRDKMFPIPELCPPPPPSLFGKIAAAGDEKEALTNMLMSWYMSGYHTGFYQGMKQAQAGHSETS